MSADKIESVRKASETMSKQSNPIEEMEHLAAKKDQFDSLMNSPQSIKPTSFERLDTKALVTDEVHSVQEKPVFAEESVTSQKSGSATDQDQKKRQQKDDSDEVEGVGATGSKKSTSESTSMMDEVSKQNKVSNFSNASPESIKTQAKDAITQIEGIKTQLSSHTQTEIKPSYQTLLKNRLSHIDDNLKIALNKVGVENPSQAQISAADGKNPIKRFIGFLSNSQNQLDTLNTTMDKFSQSGEISPANMLAIQMKMNQVSQQIELFTSLLNKALESTKTIMNVQV